VKHAMSDGAGGGIRFGRIAAMLPASRSEARGRLARALYAIPFLHYLGAETRRGATE
jgi:hypothetical protein